MRLNHLLTALALLALHDRAGDPRASGSIQWLRDNWHEEQSGMAYALAALALGSFEQPTESVDAALVEQAREIASSGNILGVAMTAAALARTNAFQAERSA